MANHTLFQQCPARGPGRARELPAQDLDATTVAQMVQPVDRANTLLAALDGKAERTFTVPCGEAQAMDDNYIDAVRDRFVGVKVSGYAVVADMALLEVSAVPVLAPEALTGAVPRDDACRVPPASRLRPQA